MTMIWHNHSTRSLFRRGFTMIELMVVVSIIMLLAGIVALAIRAPLGRAERVKCRANIGKIAQACIQYAEDDRYHRGGGVAKSLPSVNVTAANWANVADGNPACLWLLVERGFIAREAFLCPGAETRLGNYSAGENAAGFAYQENRGSSLSYSYISMVGPFRDEMTITGDINSSLVILADKNPRGEFNDPSLSPPQLPNGYTEDTLNHRPAGSSSAGRYGQNVARLDGSAEWFTDSGEECNNGDDIYAAQDPATGAIGQRSRGGEAFCIP
jgi:prepilin-type N-terminal cleavage/methylation domain-containing protein